MTDRQEGGIQQGERYAISPITGNYYRVTSWVELGDGKIRSQSKEKVDRDDVPDDWLEVLDDE